MAGGKFRLGLWGILAFAVSSHAVNLGGSDVAKEKFVVYLLIGHSNMAGMDFAHSDGVTHPKAWNWPLATKKWVPAKEPPNGGKTQGLSGNGEGGPGMPFLKGMAAAYPDYWFGVVNNASLSATCKGENTGMNASELDVSDNRYYKGTYLYKQVIDAAKAVQAEATLGGVLCMLGSIEATRTSEAVCQAFSDDLAQLAKDLRADLGVPNLPFIMGGYEQGATAEFAISKPLPAIIDAQIKLLPGKLPYSAVVDTKGITMLDNHHFTADKGQPEWAKRAIALIQGNGLFPGTATALALALGTRRAEERVGFIFNGTGLLFRSAEGEWGANGRSPMHAPKEGMRR
jgi:hypothetical protein